MGAILETNGLTKNFGGLTAVDNVDFTLEEGELRCLIGPNGAGKTTFFNLLSGAFAPTSGTILYENKDITSNEPYEILDTGIARSFQISQVFDGLSVMRNLRLGLIAQDSKPTKPSYFLSNVDNDTELTERAYDLADRVELGDIADRKVEELAHGQKRNLEIGLALSTGADVLLLDEPAAGLTVSETQELMELIQSIAEEKTILLIEHDMELVMGISQRISVLHDGRILAEGTPADIRNDETVREVYLGGSE